MVLFSSNGKIVVKLLMMEMVIKQIVCVTITDCVLHVWLRYEWIADKWIEVARRRKRMMARMGREIFEYPSLDES